MKVKISSHCSSETSEIKQTSNRNHQSKGHSFLENLQHECASDEERNCPLADVMEIAPQNRTKMVQSLHEDVKVMLELFMCWV